MEIPKPIFIVTKPSSLNPYDWSIKFGVRGADGRLQVAQPISMLEVKPEEAAPEEPMMRFDSRFAEPALTSLMDALWSAGIRPTDIGAAGHLAATQAHLKDMRTLVAKTLGVALS